MCLIVLPAATTTATKVMMLKSLAASDFLKWRKVGSYGSGGGACGICHRVQFVVCLPNPLPWLEGRFLKVSEIALIKALHRFRKEVRVHTAILIYF
jgi:hypothetical protein